MTDPRQPRHGQSCNDAANNDKLVNSFREFEDRINSILIEVQDNAYKAGWEDCELKAEESEAK